MKKKIFLISFMILALVSVFAISIFADDVVVSKTESAEFGTVIQLSQDPGLDNAKQYVSNLKKINDNGTDNEALCILTDGNTDNPSYYVFPSSYVVNEREDGKFDLIATQLVTAMNEFNTANGTSYYAGYAISGSGGGKRLDAMVRFEFTSDVTSVSDSLCCMRSYPYLEEVGFNYEIDLASAGDLFKSCSKLKTVVGFENANAALAKSIFIGCGSLESVSLPTDIVRIPNSMFWGCKKITINNLTECTQLTTIGQSAFQDTSYLVFTLPDTVTTIEKSAFQSAFKDGNGGSLTINPTSQLTTIGDDAFRDCRQLKGIYIPSTVTSIGSNAFRQTYNLIGLENFENCQITELGTDTFSYSSIKSIKLPKTLKTLGAAFYETGSLSLVYIPDSVTAIADTFAGSQPKNAVYIYTGTDASVLSACARIANANKIPASEYDEATAYTGINLVVGYSSCIAYNNGVHGVGVVDVVVTSYNEPIIKVNTCVDCKMEEIVGEIPALFECLGYSAPEDGKGGIAVGYTVNNEAIKEYIEITGKTLKYGVFVVLQSNLGENDVFGEDGTAASGVLSADITHSKLSAFELKVVGFADEQKDIKLAMGAYVAVTDGENTEYSYMQGNEPNENEKYSFVSYNDVAGKPSSNE